jgi:hypothetical protein
MKPLIIFPLFAALLLIMSCAEETDENLLAFNPEAFAFDIGDEYEVNATVRVKGFQLQKEGEEYLGSLAYELDLVRPDGTNESGIVSRIEDLAFSEKVADTGIDVQFSLDTTYPSGSYQIIFNLRDTFSGSTASATAGFNL